MDLAQGEGKGDIRISVRELVEFVLRSGDLDNRRTAAAQKDAMQAGSRIHRKLQRRMGADYRAEVTLKHVVVEDEFRILVEGRADGIIENAQGTVIDEIKGVYMDLGRLEEAVSVHEAQAKCYAYIYSRQHDLAEIGVLVTYCNMETEEVRRFRKNFTFEQLEEWFAGLIHEYVKWARYLYRSGQRRDESIHDLNFPYEYRTGQKELAVNVYRAIVRKRDLFIQAPTGIGKTLSVVYPALKAMGEGLGDKLFYLTAKTITRGVAEETLEILRRCNLYFRSVTITAKEKLCFLPSPDCNPESCAYAKGHYDRVNDAVYEIIHQEFGITREVILEYARRFRVCPFEFCLDITNWVDGIICDYNYVFDPNVRLRRYFSDDMAGNYLFLVDEAHNLVSRAREMYSARLVKEDLLLMKRLLKARSPKVVKWLERCNKSMLEMKRECARWEILPDINHLSVSLMSLFGELETFMEENQELEDRDQVLEFYFGLRDFISVHERLGDDYRIYAEMAEDGTFSVRLFCIDTSRNLRECLDKGNSAVFFSATLLPVSYYKELLSGNPEDYAVYAHSPFPEENRLLLVARDVSSRYIRRNQREFEKVLSYIRQAARGRKGNYMVFFPSYQYLRDVARLMEQTERLEEEFTWMSQSTGMNEGDREAFLREFQGEREKSFVALCVMGGIFSEGIDLKEEQLIGTVIVGTGLPMVCTEQEILRLYFDEAGKNGFDFAYQYPGMNKVMQAAGRVIRTAQDKGIILLLDDRFLRPDCRGLFPREWENLEVVTRETVGERIESFWRRWES